MPGFPRKASSASASACVRELSLYACYLENPTTCSQYPTRRFRRLPGASVVRSACVVVSCFNVGAYRRATLLRRRREHTVPPIPVTPPALPHIAWPILVALVLEWMVWPVLMQFLRHEPRCPLCETSFQWSEIDTYDERVRIRRRPSSFPCPKCLQIIGEPSWRKSFLLISYLSLIGTFMFVIFDLPGDLFWGYVGMLLAAVGAIRILDWFIWRRLEPGSPSPIT